MIFDNLSNVLWWQFRLSKIDTSATSSAPLFVEPLLLTLPPFSRLLFNLILSELSEEITIHPALAIGLP